MDLLDDSIRDFVDNGTAMSEEDLDVLFLAAYEQLDGSNSASSDGKGSGAACLHNSPTHLCAAQAPGASVRNSPTHLYAVLQHRLETKKLYDNGKTQFQNQLSKTLNTVCVCVWEEWHKHHQESASCTIPPLCDMSADQLQHWFVRFVVEVRK